MSIGRTIRRPFFIIAILLALLSSTTFAPVSQANVEQRNGLYAASNSHVAIPDIYGEGQLTVPASYSTSTQVNRSESRNELVIAKAADTTTSTIHPLDVDVTVTGTLSQGTWVTYTHNLGPNPDGLHPVKVYDSTYGPMWGVGKYATDFAAGTAPADMFGDGADGALIVATNTADNPIDAACTGTVGSQTLNATNASFAQGQQILIHQTQGTNAGQWERNIIQGYTAGTITLHTPLIGTYTTGAQVLVMKRYTNVTVNSGVTWTAKAWNGMTGGILAFLVDGTVTVAGLIVADGTGYRGASGIAVGLSGGDKRTGYSGESITATVNAYGGADQGAGWGQSTTYPAPGTGGAGGQGSRGSDGAGGGGGGGNGTSGTAGANGYPQGWTDNGGGYGTTSGSIDLTTMTFGGGGGGGGLGNPGNGSTSTAGGAGGGAIFIFGATINVSGAITSNGIAGQGGGGGSQFGGSGGGAGGSVLIKSQVATLGSSLVTANSGVDGSGDSICGAGGSGGAGRIRIEYCESISGSTNPSASTQKLTCYIAAQIETAPYNQGQLNLPENITGNGIYKVQYGRKLDFAGAGNQLVYLRVPVGLFGSVSLDALVSGLSGNALFLLDVGDDGSIDWSNTVANDSTNTNSGLASVFNSYWSSHGAPVSGTLDVPVRVWLGSAGQVLLTNLIMSPKYAYLPLITASQPPLAAPTLNAITAPGINAHYTVSWSSVPSATSYLLQEATDSSFAGATVAYSGTNLSTQIPSRNITTYFYRVMASNQNNNSSWSNSQSVSVRWELEPDNYYTQSTQILSTGQDVYGYPNDAKDFFSFYAPVNGQITVDLTNHNGQGVQLQLFYQTVSNRVGLVTGSPYYLSYSGLAGWYYVYIYSAGNYNSNSPYTLNVTYPASLAQTMVASP